jgi:hypothetical protein
MRGRHILLIQAHTQVQLYFFSSSRLVGAKCHPLWNEGKGDARGEVEKEHAI